jgi:hypothetical protein
MSDQPKSSLPTVYRSILNALAADITRAQWSLAGLRPSLPPENAEDDTSPPWRQALDCIEFDRLPALAEDLADPALGLAGHGDAGDPG